MLMPFLYSIPLANLEPSLPLLNPPFNSLDIDFYTMFVLRTSAKISFAVSSSLS